MRWPDVRGRAGGLFAVAIGVIALGSGCTPTDMPGTEEAPERPTTEASQSDHHIQALSGLSFDLPDSFARVDDPEFAYFARSTQPRALFSIAPAEPSVIDFEPRSGETFTPMVIDGVDVVVVSEAAIEGLPPGVVAAELRVSNGDSSFSAIMSAPEDELDPLWETFLDSVRLGTG